MGEGIPQHLSAIFRLVISQHIQVIITGVEDGNSVPNRYLPSALTEMIDEKHQTLITDARGKGADETDYPPEYEALVEMLQPEYQEEFRDRRSA